MEHKKITNLLGTTLNEIPRFITKKLIKFHDQSSNAEHRYKSRKYKVENINAKIRPLCF